jgi:hypothetical protein
VFARSGSAWTQQGEKLVGDCTSGCANEGAGETGEGKFATSVALSEDGDTALIGGPADNSGAGAAWVFTRSAGTWSQQGSKLTGGEEGNSQSGVYVAVSAGGNTALIGGPGDNDDAGAAWVFTRSGGVWSQQGPKLTGTGETTEDGFGVSVALSADGNTALIGAPGDNGGLFGTGAAWVFTRSDGIWTQQGEKLVGDCTSSCANEGTGEIENAWFGYNVALSADGNTALIGGFRDNDWRGAAWVFTRSGSSWAQQGEKLVGDCTGSCANEGTGESGDSMFGTMVALSANSNTALIGAWNDDNVLPGNQHYSGKGAAWVFTRSGSAWTQEGQKLVGDWPLWTRPQRRRARRASGRPARLSTGPSVPEARARRTSSTGRPRPTGPPLSPRALAPPAARARWRTPSAGLRRERPTTSGSSPKTPVEWPTAAIRRSQPEPKAHHPRPKRPPPRRPKSPLRRHRHRPA